MKPIGGIFTIIIIYSFSVYVFDDWYKLLTSYSDKILKNANMNNNNFSVVSENDTLKVRRRKLMEMCRLPDLDPWDAEIESYLDPAAYKKDKCKPEIEEVAYLKNGKMYVHEKYKRDTECKFRCVYAYNDWDVKYGEYLNFSHTPDCDIVETVCTQKFDDGASKVHKYLHVQVYRKPEEILPKVDENGQLVSQNSTDQPPDVHILIFDSTSTSSIYRTMPKTVHYLREKYDMIPFKYLNKIGMNSRPNGYAFLLGKSIKNPLEACYEPIDNDAFIGFEFQRRGYKTLWSEDWALGVFNWPDCWGFQNQTPIDHYMKPFQLRIEGDKYRGTTLGVGFYDKTCKKGHYWQLEYLKRFLEKYKHEPKFSLSWMTRLTHSDFNGLNYADSDYSKFFKDYLDKLKDSFIIIVGDHGLRLGSFRNTKIGALEDNNPMLFVILPEKLRKNEKLTKILKENSKQQISHFDLYASMMDIARNPRLSENFKNLPKNDLHLIGSSFFKPLPQPRSCSSLNIPLTNCMCQYSYKRLNDPKLTQEISQAAIDWINNLIAQNNASDKCAELTLKNNSAVLEEFEPEFRVDIYQITFTVMPSNGRFTGLIQRNFNESTKEVSYKVISDSLPRLNLYGGQEKCVRNNHVITAYCYCKDLLKRKNS